MKVTQGRFRILAVAAVIVVTIATPLNAQLTAGDCDDVSSERPIVVMDTSCPNILLQGSLDGNNGVGFVDIWWRESETKVWQHQRFGPSKGGLCGASLAHGGGYIVIGCPFASSDSTETLEGKVLLLSKSENGWTVEAVLIPNDISEFDLCGFSVGINEAGLLITVGCPGKDVGGIERAGAVYLFRRLQSGWVETGRLVTSKVKELGHFGSGRMKLQGRLAIITSRGIDPETHTSEEPKTHVFEERQGEGWIELGRLESENDSP